MQIQGTVTLSKYRILRSVGEWVVCVCKSERPGGYKIKNVTVSNMLAKAVLSYIVGTIRIKPVSLYRL